MWEVIRKRYLVLEKQTRGVRSVVAMAAKISWHKTKEAHVSLGAAPPAHCRVAEGITNILWLQVAITVTSEGNHLLDASSGKFYLTKQRVYSTVAWPLPKNTHRGCLSRERGTSWCLDHGQSSTGVGLGLPGGGAPFLDPWISPCVEPLWISNISGEPHFGFGSVRANWSKLGKKPALKSQKTVLGFQWNHKIQCQPLYLWVGYFNLTHREHFCGMFSILRDDSCSRAPHGRPVLFYEVLCCDWQSWKGHNV